MTNPITTAPADTARAMHAAEMRGQDMQDSDQDLIARLASHNDNATPGKWGQYHPCFMDEAKDAAMKDWDTSHNMSAVKGGKRWRVADWKHADDAAFAEILVNAYRSGQLITEAECQRRIDAAVLAEREAAKSLVWTLGHEIRSAMLVDEDNEQTVLDMVKATAAAISARGQK